MKSSDHISGLLFRNRFARILILIVLVVITSRGLFAQPVADFYATPGTVCTGETVYFTDNTQNITGTATYFWNFGPGATPSTATGVGPHAVTYSVLGQVTATLTVTDEVSTDEITKDNFLLIGGEAPSFTSCPGPLLEYSADPGQCNAIVDYSSLISVTGTWEPMLVFTTSGATTASGHGSGSGTSFNLGSTTVTVFATNGCVPEAICSFVIHVNTPPVARAGGPYEICQGSQATLAGSSSSEPDAACGDYIVTYNWDVDNDGINDLQGITQTLTHAMLTGYGIGEGVHTVRLEAVDAFGGSNYDYTTLTVLPNPAATLATLSPVCLDATAFNLTQGTPTGGTYSGSGITNGTTGLFDPSVAGVGTHTITYTYTDGTTGCTANAINTITVNALPTITVSTAPSCSPDLLTYTLEVTVSSGTITSSGGTVTEPGGNIWRISGVDAGTDITVTVTDGNSCANSVSVTSPDCSCPSVTAPVNGGNQSYCAGGSIPSLTVTVGAGETADWYDQATGGTLLLSGNTSFMPTVPGTYYAEARVIISGCTSSIRTVVTLTENPLPSVTLGALPAACVDGVAFNLTQGSPTGGTYSGSGITNGTTGLFDPSVAGVGTHTITYTYTDGTTGCTANATREVTVSVCTKTLNLTLFLEGLYDEFNGLVKAKECIDGENPYDLFAGNISDTLTVELTQALYPHTTVFSEHGVPISTEGTISLTTIPGALTGNYFIVIKHRNHIETWSQSLSFEGSSVNYDFTDAVNKAWGDNLVLVGSDYCLYTGDTNNDEFVDAFDLVLTFNLNRLSGYGYQVSDINADGFVDIYDLIKVFNNNRKSVGMNTPLAPMK